MIRILALLISLCTTDAYADVVVATRTMRANSIVSQADLKIVPGEVPGTYYAIDELIGQETRVVLYAGRPIKIDDIGPPALVDRNQIVILLYNIGGLSIATEGRALARGGLGDRVRIMNLSSRSAVTGTVLEDGTISVAPPQIPGS